ncbi:N-acetylglucosaminyl transferase component-domain-containing protein [Papiliotrema laurentii]|uniref:N-acetylglucosaminyl transferase component-domain-containing protein n=1 Tax=Papiliotrema laurentii TaxID=5418 RepID=A0AAD9FWN4_PAPLA|nr:N-acetylglucosaminyl transferase component-domain-containing protein [Papiliotrema laurentii]
MRVYWPTSGVPLHNGQMVGWRLGRSIIVVSIVEDRSPVPQVNVDRGGNIQLEYLGNALFFDSVAAEEPGEGLDTLRVWLDKAGLPVATNDKSTQLILYDPPDPCRLRFLRLTSQSPLVYPDAHAQTLARQDMYSAVQRPRKEEDITKVIPLLNAVRAAQVTLRSAGSLPPADTEHSVRSRCVSPAPTSLEGPQSQPRSRSLVSKHSALGGQILLRARQVYHSPKAFLKTRPDPAVSIAARSKHYMAFWNTVWLVLNDLILGYCARQVILYLAPRLCVLSKDFFTTYLVDTFLAILQWLNDWPVGLKLNTPLSAFFCSSLSFLVQSWADIVVPLWDNVVPIVLHMGANAASCGLTMAIALAQDVLALGTLHLHLCYAATSTLCRWQLYSLRALWNLFRGKRRNVLRQRTDSYAYDVDQLFLGTLLFTVSSFLLPTVAVYAGLFAATRLVLYTVDRALSYAIIALNAFPLFGLMLRLKEPSRLPAGINFSTKSSSSRGITAYPPGAHPLHNVLQICNSPRSVADILHPETS